MSASATSASETLKGHLLPWVIALLITVVATVVVTAWQSYRTPSGSGLLHALAKLLEEVLKDEHSIGRSSSSIQSPAGIQRRL
jgi:hypothetical protein